MEMPLVLLVPAPVVVLLEEGLEGADDGVGEAMAAEVWSVHVGAASASGRADKRESATENMTGQENGKGKKDREGERDWGELAWFHSFCTRRMFHCSAPPLFFLSPWQNRNKLTI